MVVSVETKATLPDPLLVRAIQTLAGRCDGALTQDGIGYNAMDTWKGHQLAVIPPADWLPRMSYWAWITARKYRQQLLSVGIDWDQIAPPRLVEHPNDWWGEYKERRDNERALERADRDYQEFQAAQQRQEATKARVAQGRMVYLQKDHPENAVIIFKYEPVLKDQVKLSVVGIRWDGDNRYWWAPITAASAPSLLALGGKFQFGFAEGVAEILSAIVGRAAANEVASKAASTSFRFNGLLREPYPFQWAGIEYAVNARRCFIADAPGLGKTIQAIAAAQHLGASFKLVICPANVKYNWRNEIVATLPDQTICIIEGEKPWAIYPEADWYIINHNITSRHLAILCQQIAIDLLIVDEGHYLSNPKAARTKAVQAIVEHTEKIDGKNVIVEDIDRRFILTGTAILNRPKEIIAQLKILGRLKDVAKSEWDFKQRFCGLTKSDGKWDDNGATDSLELNRKMRQVCYIRREKADVLTELPPKRRVVLDVPLANRAEYDRAEADMVNWLADRAVADRAFHASIAHLGPQERQQAITERRQESKSKTTAAEALVRFNALKRLAAQGKFKSVVDWVSDFLATGEKLIVFGWYRETVDELCKHLAPVHGKPVPHIHGGDSALARQATVEDFQTNPTTRLLVCNILAAGEGITLTAASNTLFAEMGWNPGKQEQSEDRVHRIGQRDSVTAWYMLANETIEGDIYDIIAAKRVITTAVNEGRELPEEELNMMREVAARLRKRHKGGQQPLPLEVVEDDDSPPWDEPEPVRPGGAKWGGVRV